MLILKSSFVYAEGDAFSYAVLDYEYVIQNSKVFESLESKIESKRSHLFSEAQKSEKFLTKQREELELQCKSIERKECESKLRKNLSEFDELNQKYRDKRSSLNDLFLKSTQQIQDHLSRIIQEKIKKRGYAIVFDRRALIHSDETKDITKDILSSLNKEMSSINVE